MAHEPAEKTVTPQVPSTTPAPRNVPVRTAIKAGADAPEQSNYRELYRQAYHLDNSND